MTTWQDIANKALTMLGVGVLIGIEAFFVNSGKMDAGILTVTITGALAALGVHTTNTSTVARTVTAMREQIKPAVPMALAAAVLAALLMPSLAFAAPQSSKPAAVTPRPAATVDIGKLITDAQSLLGRVQTGMNAADALAKASTLPEQAASNLIASQCYEAISGTAKEFSDELGTLPTDLGSDPLVLAPVIFQLNRMGVKQLIAGVPTPIAQGCAALAQDMKMDVLKLTTTLVGAAAVKTLAAGIGIPPIPGLP